MRHGLPLCELDRAAVQMMLAEGILGVPEQVMAVEERDGALFRRLFRQFSKPADNPAKASQRVRRGTTADGIGWSKDRVGFSIGLPMQKPNEG